MLLNEEKHKPLQVLIAEDDPDDQFIFETAFREISPGAELHFFYTSQGLIHHLVRAGIQNDPRLIPDLIIGDMKPPFFELKDIAEIRTYKQFEQIPVYVFAEGFLDVTRSSALTLGASGFYHKPNSLHRLKEILKEILNQESNAGKSKIADSDLASIQSNCATEKAEQEEEE